jgi:hypothetical protein
MNKYGIIVQTTEEFLRTFLTNDVLARLDVLGEIVKPIIVRNWGLNTFEEKFIDCKVQYDVKCDKYLFRLRSDRPMRGFVNVSEGNEYPTEKWFL